MTRSPISSTQHLLLLIRLSLILVLLGGFALYIHALTYQDIWWDEARNIDVALRPFIQVATAPELDIHPPLYFWLLHAWLQLAGVDRGNLPEIIAFAARLLSVVAGLLSVALLYPLGRRLHSPTAGLLACLIAATSPFWLAESQETRMYTLSFALLTAAAWFLLQATHPTRQSFTIHNSQ
ncbi:MAG: glycosyltransferase family 39 protein, partial [Caldilineaceae bacterium]|nr:glycosyltransferase family 39 protein [Caldilineaceae bacterium]